jgi:hypothetical protein
MDTPCHTLLMPLIEVNQALYPGERIVLGNSEDTARSDESSKPQARTEIYLPVIMSV